MSFSAQWIDFYGGRKTLEARERPTITPPHMSSDPSSRNNPGLYQDGHQLYTVKKDWKKKNVLICKQHGQRDKLFLPICWSFDIITIICSYYSKKYIICLRLLLDRKYFCHCQVLSMHCCHNLFNQSCSISSKTKVTFY